MLPPPQAGLGPERTCVLRRNAGGGLAVACAAANEAVWRTLSTDTWVSFKLALVPVSIIGYVAVTHLLARRHWDVEAERKAAEAPP